MSPVPQPPDRGQVLRFPDRPAEPATGRLPEGLRGRLSAVSWGYLEGHLPEFFIKLDDAWFDWAEKGGAPAAALMDALRQVRQQKDRMMRAWQQAHQQAWAIDPKPLVAAKGPEGPVALALVEPEDLEEDLAIQSLVVATPLAPHTPIHALAHRLTLLDGKTPPEFEDIEWSRVPVTPAALAQQLRDQLSSVPDLNTEARIIAYKLWGRTIQTHLGALYERLNGVLAETGMAGPAGLAPRRSPSAAATGAPHAAHHRGAEEENWLETVPARAQPGGGAGGMGHEAVGRWDADMAAQQIAAALSSQGAAPLPTNALWLALQTMAAAHPQPMANGLGALRPLALQESPWSPESLADALSALAYRAPTQPALPPVGEGWEGSEVAAVPSPRHLLPAHAIKQALLEQLSKQNGMAAEVHELGSHETTLDMVVRLFESLLESTSLSDGMKAHLGRLQFPYLRAAVLDPRWMQQENHPAKRFLDVFEEMGQQGTAAEPGGALYEPLAQAIHAIAHDRRPHGEVFEEVLPGLQEALAQQKRRAEVRERRVAETEAGTDRRVTARRAIAGELVKRMHGAPLHPRLHALIMSTWAQQLILSRLNGNEQQESLDLKVVERLVWASRVDPSESAAHLWSLESPRWMDRWEQGLMRGGMDSNQAQKARQMVAQYLNACVSGKGMTEAKAAWEAADPAPAEAPARAEARSEALLASAAQPPRAAHASDAALSSGVSGSATSANPVPTVAPSKPTATPLAAIPIGASTRAPATTVRPEDHGIDAEAWDQARTAIKALTIGAWLELGEKAGAGVKAKVIWISVMTRRVVLVGPNGLKLEEVHADELAVRWHKGLVRPLTDAPWVDRAVHHMAKTLLNEHRPAPEQGQSAD